MKITFVDAIKLGFKNFFKFGGRATRREYWFFILFNALVSGVASSIDYAIGGEYNNNWLGGLVGLALFFPLLTLLFRRFRDAGVSPLWLLTWLVPFGAFVGWIINNINVFVSLYNDSQIFTGLQSLGNDEAAFNAFVSAHPELVSLVSQLLMVIGLFLIWALFEFIVTLLPSKKDKQSLVASTDY